MTARKRKSRGIKKEKRRRIKLSIEAKDFGPITGGKVTVKPLTLFIGPNNSGKSYAAMLMHSIFESYSPTSLTRGAPFLTRGRFYSERSDIRNILKESLDMKRQIGDLKKGIAVNIPKQFIEKVTHKILEEIYEKRLTDEIIRSYASPLSDLIRIGKKLFSIVINFNSCGTNLTYLKDKLRIKIYPQLDIKIGIKTTKSSHAISIDRENERILLEIDENIWKDDDFIKSPLTDIIFDICGSKIFERVSMPCYYLPAARSGILQGHKALAASIVKKAPYVGIERLEIPKFSGVVSDFISSVLTLPEEKGPFYHLAQEFEKELIKGQIVIRALDEYVSEIKYDFQGTEIPLHRASSTVSELAPLFLYLKYTIQPESILIIEEPEAHLHPENQRLLAKFLIKLIRQGVNIVITTHSEYLLDQLSSFMLLSKIKPQKRTKRYKYSGDDFLKPDEIAVYVFDYDKKSAGHKISEVEITEEDGISQDEFLKIHEALYEERFKLQRDLSS